MGVKEARGLARRAQCRRCVRIDGSSGRRYHGGVARPGSKVWLVLIAIPALLIAAGVAWLAWRQSVPRVRAELAPVPRYIGIKTPLAVRLAAVRL